MKLARLVGPAMGMAASVETSARRYLDVATMGDDVTGQFFASPKGKLVGAREYARWLDGVAARHGVELLQIFEVRSTPTGAEPAGAIFLLRAPSPGAFAASVEDPEYAARVPLRNKTFRMDEVRRFVVKPILVGDQVT